MTTLNKFLIAALAATVLLAGCISGSHKILETNKDLAKTSVMITNEAKTSGGSGVIVYSMPSGSYVLTNKHVCGLIQVGGLVSNESGSYPVYSFRVYSRHDLCLIRVLTNLHVNTAIAEKEPELYSPAIVVGHPALYPTMITKGHFTTHVNISVVVGTQDCDGNEQDEEMLMCMMFGKKPQLVTLEAQPTTATIMPGSSGSGVLNAKGEISALVFAGRGDLSYGFLVPYAYVRDFMYHLKLYPEQFPKKDKKQQNFFADIQKINEFCRVSEKHCKGIADSGLFYGQ